MKRWGIFLAYSAACFFVSLTWDFIFSASEQTLNDPFDLLAMTMAIIWLCEDGK